MVHPALRTNVDAARVGGAARFVNHSCAPNLELRVCRCRARVAGRAGDAAAARAMQLEQCCALRLGFYALRDIAPGDELSFSYGEPAPARDDGSAPPRTPCACGAPGCAGVMPYDPTAS